MITKKIERLVLMQIQSGLDVRLLRGSLRWSLTDCSGASRAAWRLQRDDLVARIAMALIQLHVHAKLVADWTQSGKISLVLKGKTKSGKRWEEKWKWPEE